MGVKEDIKARAAQKAKEFDDMMWKHVEMINWAEEQIKDYKKGKLNKRQIKKLEEIEGWSWETNILLKDIEAYQQNKKRN